jgi:hypothetical protein
MAITAKLLTRTVVFALATSAMVLLHTASPAHACSCAGIERALADGSFDAAFVGTVVEAPPPFTSGNSASLVNWKFRVDEVYRGQLPATVDIKTAASGASCGFGGFAVGTQVGLLLRREGNDWTSGLCSTGTPQQLASLGKPSPPTTGAVPTTTIASGLAGGDDDGNGNGKGVGVALAVGGALVAIAGASTAVFTRRRHHHATA